MRARAGWRLRAVLRQERVALADRARDVDHGAIAPAGVIAQPLEGRAVIDRVALHEDALRALDDRAALERPLEALDLVEQRPLRLEAPGRHLDRPLDRLWGLLARVGEDPAAGGLGDELRVLLVDERDD